MVTYVKCCSWIQKRILPRQQTYSVHIYKIKISSLNLFYLLQVMSQRMQILKHQRCMNPSGHWTSSRIDSAPSCKPTMKWFAEGTWTLSSSRYLARQRIARIYSEVLVRKWQLHSSPSVVILETPIFRRHFSNYPANSRGISSDTYPKRRRPSRLKSGDIPQIEQDNCFIIQQIHNKSLF